MSRDLKLTKTAETHLRNLIEYLDNSWPEKVKIDFIKKMDNCVSKVAMHPNLFPRSFIKKDCINVL